MRRILLNRSVSFRTLLHQELLGLKDTMIKLWMLIIMGRLAWVPHLLSFNETITTGALTRASLYRVAVALLAFPRFLVMRTRTTRVLQGTVKPRLVTGTPILVRMTRKHH